MAWDPTRDAAPANVKDKALWTKLRDSLNYKLQQFNTLDINGIMQELQTKPVDDAERATHNEWKWNISLLKDLASKNYSRYIGIIGDSYKKQGGVYTTMPKQLKLFSLIKNKFYHMSADSAAMDSSVSDTKVDEVTNAIKKVAPVIEGLKNKVKEQAKKNQSNVIDEASKAIVQKVKDINTK